MSLSIKKYIEYKRLSDRLIYKDDQNDVSLQTKKGRVLNPSEGILRGLTVKRG
jgi:hypothetical protein